jgi:hypothetical protein
MVMVVVMMMVLRGERRAGKHHQQQGSGKNLFHGTNVARGRRRRKRIQRAASRLEQVFRARLGSLTGLQTGVPSDGSWSLGWKPA